MGPVHVLVFACLRVTQVVFVYCCCGMEVVTDPLSDYFWGVGLVLVPFMAIRLVVL